MKQSGVVDAEFEEQDQLRPCLGMIEVPIEAIDGTPSVGAVLQVRGKGDGFVVLEVGSKSVRVRADQLDAALRSLAVLTQGSVYGAVMMPDGPYHGPPFGGPSPPFARRMRRPIP